MALLALALLAGGREADRRIVEQSFGGGIDRRRRAVAHIGRDRRFEIGDRDAETILQFGNDAVDERGGIGAVLR